MALLAGRLQHGIDLDGVDVLGSRRQGHRDVVAVPRPDHEHVLERVVPQVIVRIQIKRLTHPQVVQRQDRLMRQPVHLDPDPSLRGRSRHADAVVGRPAVQRREGSQSKERDQSDQRGDLPATQGTLQHEEEHACDHDAPHHRPHPQERERGEPDDAGDATDDVQTVRLERLELSERTRDALSDQRHDHRHREEDHGQRDPRWEREHAEQPLELACVAGVTDLHGKQQHERDVGGQGPWSE